MKNSLKLLLLALAVLSLVVVWTSTRSREARPTAPPAPADRPLPAAHGEAPSPLEPDARLAASAAESAPTAERPAASGRLAGRVLVRDEDQPLARARVRCRRGETWLATTADDAGRFAFDFDSAVKIERMEVAATDATAGAHEFVAVYVRPGATSTHDMWVTRGASLSGRVVDLEHRAVPGAEVLAWCAMAYEPDSTPDRRAIADADGAFELAHVGASLYVTARAPGLACRSGVQGRLAAGQRAEGLELVLAPAGSLHGRVLGDEDVPVAGAQIEIAQSSWSSDDDTDIPGLRRFVPAKVRATSDVAGRFTFTGLPLACELDARVDHAEHPPWQGRVAAGADEVVIHLEHGCELRGRVFARGGASIAGAEIKLRPASPHSTTVSDATGQFRLSGLAATNQGLLLVHASGYAVSAEAPLEIRAEPSPWHDVQLEPGRVLAGRVLDRDERPLAGWSVKLVGERKLELPDVRIVGEDTTPEWAFGLQRTSSDDQGAFRFVDLLDGEYVVRAHSNDGSDLRGEVRALAGREDVLVRIDPDVQPSVEFAGRATDAATGERVREFSVTPMVSSGDLSQGSNTRVVDDDGRFQVAGLPEATIDLYVEAEGYATWSSGGREYTNGRYEFDVALLAARTVRLRAVDSSMQPPNRPVFVSFQTLDGRRLGIRASTTTTATSINLVQGEASAAGLPAALIQVKFQSIQQNREWTFDLDLRAARDDVVQFVLDAPPEVVFGAVVFGAARATAAELGAGELTNERGRELSEAKKLWPIDARTELSFENAAGEVVASATIEPREGGLYEIRWSRVDENAATAERSQPWLDASLPTSVARVRVQAVGYDERVVPLTFPREEPLSVVLVRSE